MLTRLRASVRHRLAWLPTAMASLAGARESLWRRNLPEELIFWDQYLANKGAPLYKEGYRRRVDPNSQLDPDLGRYIKDENATVLDVGAGPITMLGYVWNGHRVRITAVDPLASQYGELLTKHGIIPPIPTQDCRGEELTTMFPLNFFDITHARNCLDHSIDAVESIKQMYAVTKPGGVVYLRHLEAEAKHASYRGLHRWNFELIDGDMTLSSPGRSATSLNTVFGAVEAWRNGTFIEAAIRKPDDVRH